ncbi:hypothetical protein GCM10010349_43420 [Streptomyces flavofungini]|nr:hypothetical protein GCM10010349_43420 [Streptomyces flavofungini]
MTRESATAAAAPATAYGYFRQGANRELDKAVEGPLEQPRHRRTPSEPGRPATPCSATTRATSSRPSAARTDRVQRPAS